MLSDRAADEPALIAMAQHGDKAAMGTLLARFQPMLWLLSRRLSSTAAIPWEELVQAGNLGLMQAVRRYDEQQNVRLITYAVPWILGEMRRTLRSMQFRCLSLEEERGEESRTLMECLQGAGGVVLWACKDESPAVSASAPSTSVNPIAQSIDAILHVGGCIICYSVLASLLRFLPMLSDSTGAIVHGLLEVSGGVHALCTAATPGKLRAVLLSVLCGFSGFSILSQNHAFLAPLGVRMTQLIAFALLRAFFAGCLMAMLYARFIP